MVRSDDPSLLKQDRPTHRRDLQLGETALNSVVGNGGVPVRDPPVFGDNCCRGASCNACRGWILSGCRLRSFLRLQTLCASTALPKGERIVPARGAPPAVGGVHTELHMSPTWPLHTPTHSVQKVLLEPRVRVHSHADHVLYFYVVLSVLPAGLRRRS